MSVNSFADNEDKAQPHSSSELQLHVSHDRYQKKKKSRHKSEYLEPPNT